MNLIDLETAVGHIAEVLAKRPSASQPFFFLVGAGISYPQVPLAASIIEHCKAIASQDNRIYEPSRNKPIQLYSHWFQRAYPQRVQRQDYLKALISNKPISGANFRLAHLLSEGTLTNMVITPNFDDFLSRALKLLMVSHIICDHPLTVDRINVDSPQLQIVHVHGTFLFYDCCNLGGEIRIRATISSQSTLSMASLLDRLLSHRSPLVIGYSGWEGDVIMKALKRRLRSPLAYNLYWFCYRESAISDLPPWLRNNSDVYFVVPLKQNVPPLSARESSGEIVQTLATVPSLTTRQGMQTCEPTLPAKDVFDRLIAKLNLGAPKIATDPFTVFVDLLKGVAPQSEPSDQTDLYGLTAAIQRLERAKEREKSIAESVQDAMETIRQAIQRAQYGQVLQQQGRETCKYLLTELTEDQLFQLAEAIWLAMIERSDDSKDELLGHDLVITIWGRLQELGRLDAFGPLKIGRRSLWRIGGELFEFRTLEETLQVNQTFLDRYSDATEPSLRRKVARASILCGLLMELKQDTAAIEAYDKVITRYQSTGSEYGLQDIAIEAMAYKVLALEAFNEKDTDAAYYQLMTVHGEGGDHGYQQYLTEALFYKGLILEALQQNDAAIAAFDRVVECCGRLSGDYYEYYLLPPALRHRCSLMGAKSSN